MSMGVNGTRNIVNNEECIKVNDNVVVTSSELDYSKSVNHVCYIKSISIPDYEIDFIIDKNAESGLSYIFVDVYKKSGDKTQRIGRFRIGQWYGIALVDILEDGECSYILATSINTRDYITFIRSYLEDFAFDNDPNYKVAYSKILPSLKTIISEVLDIWYRKLDKYIEFLKNASEAGTIGELIGNVSVDEVIRYIEKAKDQGKNKH